MGRYQSIRPYYVAVPIIKSTYKVFICKGTACLNYSLRYPDQAAESVPLFYYVLLIYFLSMGKVIKQLLCRGI